MATRASKASEEEEELLDPEVYQDVLLPFEKGSHNSAKLVIPVDDKNNDNDHLVHSLFARDTFRERLASTIQACRELGKSSLWVYVTMARASLMEDMGELGLTFHHASGDVAVLNLWLKESESKIPEFATHNGTFDDVLDVVVVFVVVLLMFLVDCILTLLSSTYTLCQPSL